MAHRLLKPDLTVLCLSLYLQIYSLLRKAGFRRSHSWFRLSEHEGLNIFITHPDHRFRNSTPLPSVSITPCHHFLSAVCFVGDRGSRVLIPGGSGPQATFSRDKRPLSPYQVCVPDALAPSCILVTRFGSADHTCPPSLLHFCLCWRGLETLPWLLSLKLREAAQPTQPSLHSLYI